MSCPPRCLDWGDVKARQPYLTDKKAKKTSGELGVGTYTRKEARSIGSTCPSFQDKAAPEEPQGRG